MKVAILTDTNSGIFTPDENAGLFVLPMPIVIGDSTYYEGENLSEKELCQFMEQGEKVTTSQPPIGLLMDKLDTILADGFEEVVYIPMSSSLSSSCHTAQMVAKEYGGKVHVVDNRRISVTQKDSVMDALRLAQKKSGKENCPYLGRRQRQQHDLSFRLVPGAAEKRRADQLVGGGHRHGIKH